MLACGTANALLAMFPCFMNGVPSLAPILIRTLVALGSVFLHRAVPLLSLLFLGRTFGAFGVEGSSPSFSRSVHPCVSAESLTPRSDSPSLSVIKVPLFKVLIKVQVPRGSTSRFHIKVPLLKVQVPQTAT